jgi:hypothetical protein
MAGSVGGVLQPFIACVGAWSRGATRMRRCVELGGMAGVGDVYSGRSDGVGVSNEEVLRCMWTAGETVVIVKEVVGVVML